MKNGKYYLGLEIVRSEKGLYVNQHKYVLDLIDDAWLMISKPALTPLQKGVNFSKDEGELLEDPHMYRRLIRRLLYLGFTRLDLAYATQQLSQYVQAPRTSHWNGELHVLKYLKGCPSLGLFFPSNNTLNVKGYCDVD